jgi:ketosteroid isomerase-like protein
MVRFPGAYHTLAALGQRLVSPRSRLRRALLRRQVVSGWSASARRDFELMLVRYAPDVEVEFDSDFEALGLGETFRGHRGNVELLQTFREAWERWEVLPKAVLDLGDRVLVLGTVHLGGAASGVEFERELAQLLTLQGGLVAREQDFLAWDKGLRAAGLDPKAVALPSREKLRQAARGSA